MEDEVEEEVKFELPRPDMSKVIGSTPKKLSRAVNPYDE
jgi:hypothetical protein